MNPPHPKTTETEFPESSSVFDENGVPDISDDLRARYVVRKPSSVVPSTVVPLMNRFCATLKASEQTFFLTDEIQRHLEDFLAGEEDVKPAVVKAARRMLRGCPEILIDGNATYAVLRPELGFKQIVCFHPHAEQAEWIDREKYLEIKDARIQGHEEAAKRGLILDFSPYFRDFPKIREAEEMGAGLSLLSRRLAAQLCQNANVFQSILLDFLKNHTLEGSSILLNEHIAAPKVLLEELSRVRLLLKDYSDDDPYEEVSHELRTHGFEAGWGRTVGDIKRTLALLAKVLESSDPGRVETLLGRLPLIRTLLMVSPHGWFAQEGVLGRPDTGGQVTYVLDQARAMEQRMYQLFYNAGIAATPHVVVLTRLIPNADVTTCNVPREKIYGTDNCWILRVPFRDESGEIVPDWISRFRIWPYLERFSEDSRQAVVNELMGTPDLIVGHYTDGNLVAHRLAEDMGVTHCACVHALEKTKYLLSDMYWGEMEAEYHFSVQFTADLIAYNSADFILSSSYREVGGTEDGMGMIEAYEVFSMPGLYRVRSGFDPRLARHNIVPPGASEQYFFPHTDRARRIEAIGRSLQDRFLGQDPTEGCVGRLDNPDLPFVFAMARMDKIKNLSGLIEIFGRSGALQSKANLLLITSTTDAAQSNDTEEIEEIRRAYELIEKYELNGHLRWCGARLDKEQTGEIYRMVADRGGVFAQPAFMETFGLTVIEAMACGLPVVVTCFGGPSEIVVPGVSGEVRNPNDQEEFARALTGIVGEKPLWQRYSEGGIQRVEDAFTWRRHAEQVLRLANIYSYWNHIDIMNRQALDQYIHTLYYTVYRPRVLAMLPREEKS